MYKYGLQQLLRAFLWLKYFYEPGARLFVASPLATLGSKSHIYGISLKAWQPALSEVEGSHTFTVSPLLSQARMITFISTYQLFRYLFGMFDG